MQNTVAPMQQICIIKHFNKMISCCIFYNIKMEQTSSMYEQNRQIICLAYKKQ